MPRRHLTAAKRTYQELGLPLEEALVDFAEASLSDALNIGLLRTSLDAFKSLGAESWVDKAQKQLDNMEGGAVPAS